MDGGTENRCKGASRVQVHTVDAPRRLFPNAGAQLSFLCQLSAVSLSLIDGCLFLEKLDERERESPTGRGDQGPSAPASLV